MTIKPLHHKSLLFALAIAGAMSSAAHAEVLVAEGFNYSGTNNSNINGVTETGTGLQGSWAVTNTFTTSGVANSLYQTSGLSFGSIYGSTAGGALRQSTTFQSTNAQSIATVQLDLTTAVTGELWGSYLVNYATISLANGGFALEGISTSAGGASTFFASAMLSNTPATSRQLQVAYDTTLTSSSAAIAFQTNTTYIYISKYTNVGTTLTGGSPGVATTWVMSQSQYETWVAGGATEATLTANSLATRTESVTSGVFNFDDNGFLTLKTDAPNFNGNSVAATYDEILYGTTLGDVYKAIPEPSATALLFGAGVSVLLFRRKRVV